jgi:hypothetical protein
MHALYDSDYDRYASLVIKEAECLHKKLALKIHPDKQASPLTAALKPRCGPAMAVLNNALDAVREAFTRHVVPGVSGLQAYFALSGNDDDAPAMIVLRWDCSQDVETEIAISGDGDDDDDIIDIWRVGADVGIQTLSLDDYPHLFSMQQITFTASHIGLFGAQADFSGVEARLVLPTTEEVFECLESRQRCKELEEEVRKLRSTLKERRDRDGPIGAKPEASSHKRAWEKGWGDYGNNHNYGKKQRFGNDCGATPPWRRSSASAQSWAASSSWQSAWKSNQWRRHSWKKW